MVFVFGRIIFYPFTTYYVYATFICRRTKKQKYKKVTLPFRPSVFINIGKTLKTPVTRMYFVRSETIIVNEARIILNQRKN